MSTAIEEKFSATRRQSVDFCAPLNLEDYCLQAEDFVSPPKWHLAHTTWFFETFLLKAFATDYASPEPLYEMLFNSYYNGIGEMVEITSISMMANYSNPIDKGQPPSTTLHQSGHTL